LLAPDGRRLGPNEIFFMLARDRRAFFYAGHEKHFLLISVTFLQSSQYSFAQRFIISKAVLWGKSLN
jgi:hypothetical protein